MTNVKLALRTLIRTPFVSSVAILSLALGIGATSAIFSLFNQFLLRPLPVADPAGLVNLGAPGPKPGNGSCNQSGDCEQVFSMPMFRDLARMQTVFTAIAAHRVVEANLAFNGQTLNGSALLVSGSYFGALGLRPMMGRLIAPVDDSAGGGAPVAVLSHDFWRNHFASSPDVLNRRITVNGAAMTIVGVAPAGFEGTTLGVRPHVFVTLGVGAPVNPFSRSTADRRAYWLYLFARLKPGVSLEQARTALNGQYHAVIGEVEAPLQTGMSEQTMTRFRAKRIVVEPGARGQWGGDVGARPLLTLLLGVTALVLLIACANIANLLLARSFGRAAEMSVRVAIGAARRHIVALLLTESCTLAVFGGIAGFFVARWTLTLIASLVPREAADLIQLRLDPIVVMFAAVLTIGTGVLFGLFPAFHSSRPDLVTPMKGQGGQPSGARTASRFRSALATAQIALATLLLVSAGLFTKSLLNVSRVELGLRTDHLFGFAVSPGLNGYTPERSRQIFERLEEELSALPGVTDVSGSLIQILASSNWGEDVSVEGFDAGPDTDTNVRYNEVGQGYFHTLGIPMIAGREFTRQDGLDTPRVAIVNQAFARKFNLGRDVIGKHVGNRGEKPDIEIVGLVQDAKYSEVKGDMPPQYFRPYRQNRELRSLNFYARTTIDPEQVASVVPRVVARVDPNLPVEFLTTMTQQVHENLFVERVVSVLSAAFAGLATLLAAIGVYGVLAFTVAQRTREIGLRIALGVAPARVRALILRQVATMALIGTVLGLAAAAALGRIVESLLYELKGRDIGVLAAAGAALALIALGAGFIPAWRASRIDPMQALRSE
ncbi:MAG TPA: ABC transporter permease [Vicinamibacterales bacterium]|nr:ABC transporter permease [Vicinamibacterales bacterium]